MRLNKLPFREAERGLGWIACFAVVSNEPWSLLWGSCRHLNNGNAFGLQNHTPTPPHPGHNCGKLFLPYIGCCCCCCCLLWTWLGLREHWWRWVAESWNCRGKGWRMWLSLGSMELICVALHEICCAARGRDVNVISAVVKWESRANCDGFKLEYIITS